MTQFQVLAITPRGHQRMCVSCAGARGFLLPDDVVQLTGPCDVCREVPMDPPDFTALHRALLENARLDDVHTLHAVHVELRELMTLYRRRRA